MLRTTQTELPSQAILFLTHRNSSRVYHHFERLRQDLKDMMPVFLCLHRPNDEMPAPPFVPDFTVTVSDSSALLPERYKLVLAANGSYRRQMELAYLPAMLRQQLRDFAFLWMIEEDVDFSGNWRIFFDRLARCGADLIGMHFSRRKESEAWMHWANVSLPAEVPPEMVVRGFFPLVRFSSRLLTTLCDEMRKSCWLGHAEALYPTIALHHGFSLGTLSPRPRHRVPSLCEIRRATGDYFANIETFHCDFNLGTSYFHEAPQGFLQPNILYHPIKVDMTAADLGLRFGHPRSGRPASAGADALMSKGEK